MKALLLPYEIVRADGGRLPLTDSATAFITPFVDLLVHDQGAHSVTAGRFCFRRFEVRTGGTAVAACHFYQTQAPAGVCPPPAAADRPVLAIGRDSGSWDGLLRLVRRALVRYERTGDELDLFDVPDSFDAAECAALAAALGGAEIIEGALL